MSGLSAGEEASDETTASFDDAPAPAKSKTRRVLLTALAIIVVAVVLVVDWVYKYSPIAQSLQTTSGEWSSYVANAKGIEAHYTFTSTPDVLGAEQVWSEPLGTFSVEVETEVVNTGSHAVRIDRVGKQDFGYKTSDYRISFFRQGKSGHIAGAPFHSFTLAGHAQRMVVVDYSQWCATSATAGTTFYGLSSLPVTYSYFGFAHTVNVPAMPFVIQARQAC
jgi:hypothetical protein